jgi:ribosomal protein S21
MLPLHRTDPPPLCTKEYQESTLKDTNYLCIPRPVGDTTKESGDVQVPLTKCKPLQVEVGDYRTFEAAVKKFRKKVDKEGTVKAFVLRKSFVSKSTKRRNSRLKKQYLRKKYGIE